MFFLLLCEIVKIGIYPLSAPYHTKIHLTFISSILEIIRLGSIRN